MCSQFKQEHWVVVCAVWLNKSTVGDCVCTRFKQEHQVVVCAVGLNRSTGWLCVQSV